MGGNPFDALIVGCYDGDKLKYVAKVRAGFVPHMRCTLSPLFQQLRTDRCPFSDLPEKRRTLYSLTRDEMQNCQWLKPLLVAQIELESGHRTVTCGTRASSGYAARLSWVSEDSSSSTVARPIRSITAISRA